MRKLVKLGAVENAVVIMPPEQLSPLRSVSVLCLCSHNSKGGSSIVCRKTSCWHNRTTQKRIPKGGLGFTLSFSEERSKRQRDINKLLLSLLLDSWTSFIETSIIPFSSFCIFTLPFKVVLFLILFIVELCKTVITFLLTGCCYYCCTAGIHRWHFVIKLCIFVLVVIRMWSRVDLIDL